MSKPTGHKAVNNRPKRRKLWRIALWTLLVLLLLLALFVYWVWINRLTLMQEQIILELENRGFDAELVLTDLQESRAEIEDIHISKDGQTLLEANALELSYVWRDAVEGRFEKVRVVNPELSIEIDQDGKIYNPIGGTGGGAETDSLFPAQGVEIVNGRVTINSPVGVIETLVDGQVDSMETLSLTLQVQPANLTMGEVKGTVSGTLDLDYKDMIPTTSFELLIEPWQYKNMSGQGLRLQGETTYQLEDDRITITGPLKASLNEFLGKAVKGRHITLDWNGELGLTRGEDTVFLGNGEWIISADEFAVTRSDIRRQLANMMTLHDSLVRTPVTRDFAGPLRRSVEELLKTGLVQGRGQIVKTQDKTVIDMSGPMVWEGSRHSVELYPEPDKPEYEFMRSEQKLTIRLNAKSGGQFPMKIDQGELLFRSTNGRNIKSADGFKGQVSLLSNWTSQTPEGQPAEIRPLSAAIRYRGGDGPRTLSLSGKLDYDGDIPGGYAKGLKTEGKLDVLLGDRTDVYFKARNGSKVSMDLFNNPTEWTATNIEFSLEPASERPLFSTQNQQGQLQSRLSNLKADLANGDRSRTLAFTFGSADIAAEISNQQSWDIRGQDIRMTSDNTPSAGTLMTTDQAHIIASVSPDRPSEFTIETPRADVRTNAVNAKGLAVQVAGIPEAFRVDYQNGKIKFLATDFPSFDMTGYVNYQDENWVGAADTVLPYDKKTPAIVEYRFIDSKGYAKVDIPELNFSPGRLQPQSFIPALRGKIADVEGLAVARVDLEFSEADGVKSSGTARLIDMDMATAPGPLSGLNSELTFSSFFPLVTDGVQTATIKAWDVGVPLPDGIIKFKAIPDGIDIQSATWPLGTGEVSLEPTRWSYTADANRMTLRMQDVSIGKLLGDFGSKNFEMTGNISGVLPIVISGINMEVENGKLAVTDGGVVRFSTPFTDKAGESSGYAQLAFDTLKEFYYEALEFTINGPLDGLVSVRMVFNGFNPNVMEGAYIRYNINIEGELFNIINNFQKLGARVTEEVKRVVLEENAQDGENKDE